MARASPLLGSRKKMDIRNDGGYEAGEKGLARVRKEEERLNVASWFVLGHS